MKKIISVILSVAIIVTFSFTMSFAAGTVSYNPTKALEKAQSITSKQSGNYDCIGFVRTCVEAGGIPVEKNRSYGYTPEQYINYLTSKGYAVKTKLTYTQSGNYYRIYDALNVGLIHEGDILLYKCTKSSCDKRYYHVEIFGGLNYQGMWTTYSANPWKDNTDPAIIFDHKVHNADKKSHTKASEISDVEVYSVQMVCEANGFTAPEGKITSLQGKLKTYNSVNLSWEAAEGATGYKIYSRAASSGSYKYVKSVSGTSAVLTGLTQGKPYSFKVVPYKTTSGIKIDGTAKSITSIYTLKKISEPTVSKKGSSKVTVKWKNINGETGYEVSQAAKGKTKVVYSIENEKATSAVIKKVKSNLYYKVRAFKVVDGNKVYGPWSNQVKF